jgi:hypothetical protein
VLRLLHQDSCPKQVAVPILPFQQHAIRKFSLESLLAQVFAAKLA